MNKFIKLGVVCVCIQLSCLSVWAQDKLAPFTLSDQKDVAHTIQFPNKKRYVIIVADKNSSAEAKLFGENISKSVGETVEYVSVVAVGSVPSFLKGSVKGKVQGKRLTLLDWDNKVVKKLGYHEAKCLVLAVDTDGSILDTEEGAYTKDKVAELVAELQK